MTQGTAWYKARLKESNKREGDWSTMAHNYQTRFEDAAEQLQRLETVVQAQFATMGTMTSTLNASERLRRDLQLENETLRAANARLTQEHHV